MSTEQFPAWVSAALPEDAVELGRLAGPWGVKGWTKVVPYSKDAEVLQKAKQWFLCAPQGRYAKGFEAFTGTVQVNVDQCKPHSDGLVALLTAVTDRDQIASLKSASVWVSRQQFPPAKKDEYYWVDLMDLAVINREGLSLGVVTDLVATGPSSVLVVTQGEGDAAVERLIPFVPVYVDDVDLAKRTILVDWQPDY
jgi:16S rRNA processing protein RimM